MDNKYCLHHNAYRCFLSFDDLDEIDEEILELYNPDLKVREVKHQFNFSTEWIIDNVKYNFLGKKYINDWTVGFVRNGDFDFIKVDSNKYLGDVFTGVFESLKMLLQEHQVHSISFSIPETHTWLIDFCTGGPFLRYLKNHFGFWLKKTDYIGGIQYWVYERDFEDEWNKDKIS